MNQIPTFLNAVFLADGVKAPIGWDMQLHPQTIVVGATGSGKTYAVKLLQGKISKYLPDAQLWLCDYKNMDFVAFKGCKRHFGYEDVVKGLDQYYEAFQLRLNGDDTTTTPQVLLFDEWGAYIASRGKKEGEEIKSKLAALLMLGRSYHFHLMVSLQRADSEHFRAGARDQFSQILGLGNLSKEQKQMLFPDYKEQLAQVINGRGQGFLLQDGKPLKRVVVPVVRDMGRLDEAIRDGLNR